MKKVIPFALMFAVILSAMVFSQEQQDPQVSEISELIAHGLDMHKREIRDKSEALTVDQRVFLFTKYKKGIFLYQVLNVIPGSGLGSWIQQDKIAHPILGISDLVGAGLVIGGVIWGLSSMRISLFGSSGSSGDPGASVLIGIGLGTMGAVRVAGIVFPVVHATTYNDELRFSLRIAQ